MYKIYINMAKNMLLTYLHLLDPEIPIDNIIIYRI